MAPTSALDENAAVLIDRDESSGTRIFGPVGRECARELRGRSSRWLRRCCDGGSGETREEVPHQAGDTVQVIQGKEVGKKGKVLHVLEARNGSSWNGSTSSSGTCDLQRRCRRWGDRARGEHAHQQREAGLPQLQPARAGRRAHRGRRKGPLLQECNVQVDKASDGSPRLKEKYLKDVVPALRKEYGYANVMEYQGHQDDSQYGPSARALTTRRPWKRRHCSSVRSRAETADRGGRANRWPISNCARACPWACG